MEARSSSFHGESSVSAIMINILCCLTTLPFSRPNSNRVKFLRQSVTLTGFGTETFEKGIKALNEVHALFDRHIPENKLGECTIIDKCDEHLGIHLTNRYFTSRRESPTEPHIPFASDVDPMGYLANLVGGTYFQSEQNIVKHYNRSVGKGGLIK